MSAKRIIKGIARGAYKAKTAPLQAANMVGKAVAPNSKVSKAIDSVANPKILKNKGGKVSRYGMKKGYMGGGYAKMKREGMAKGGVVHHNSLKDIDKSYNTMKIEGEK